MNRDTTTTDRYLFAQNISELQKQAGVEREVAELVVAFGRLCVDKGKPVQIYSKDTPPIPWNRGLAGVLERNPDLDPRAQEFLSAYSRAMHSRRLPTIYTKTHLASRLRVTEKQLDWLAYGKDRYRTFFIPKANGSPRRVDEPVEKLKSVQRWILFRILDKLPAHKAAQAFRPNRSIVTNARTHLQKKILVRIDLEDFFPSTTLKQARKVFLKAGYPYTVANLLANLCCRECVLPIGAPTSPALANQVCRKLDNRLWLLARDRKFSYSRYADDLVFSSSNRKFASLVPFLKQVITEEGFGVNERKLVIARRGSRQSVTGIVVNRRANVPSERRKWIRAVLHNCQHRGAQAEFEKWRARMNKEGREAPSDMDTFANQLAGQIAFIRQANPKLGDRLWQQFKEIEFA